jgi:hypothetical protein
MKRLMVIALAGLALANAGPAWAHEEINPATVQTGKPVFLTFNAANEKTVDLTSIRLVSPNELPFGAATREPAGWTVAKSSAAVTWTGALKPTKFESWGFEIEGADQPGTPTYKVTLGYADNSTEDVDVVLTVTAATGGSASGTDTGDDGGSGKATVAIALAAAALALAVGALAATRKRATPGRPGTPGTPATAGEKQDW